MKERPSPTPASDSFTDSLIKFWALLFIPFFFFTQSLLGLSFPAAKEDQLSVFPEVKKLNCAFMAEEL